MASENFNKNLINSTNQNSTVSLNPLEYPSVVCDKCGCETFYLSYVFKKIPGMLVGSGASDELMPIKVFVCTKCGELMPEYKNTKTESDNNKKSNLII